MGEAISIGSWSWSLDGDSVGGAGNMDNDVSEAVRELESHLSEDLDEGLRVEAASLLSRSWLDVLLQR